MKLTFIADTSTEYGIKMSKLIDEVCNTKEDEEKANSAVTCT